MNVKISNSFWCSLRLNFCNKISQVTLRRPPQQIQGHAAGSAARSPWTSWRGLLTSLAAEEVGREIGGRYSITEKERRIDSNDGQPYTWKETLDYYTNKGWYVFEVKEHWNKLNRASHIFYV